MGLLLEYVRFLHRRRAKCVTYGAGALWRAPLLSTPKKVPQMDSIERPLGRSPRGAGRTASRGLGAGGKQNLAFDLLRNFALYPDEINKR